MLKQDTYLGQTANFKIYKPSFKRMMRDPPEKQEHRISELDAIIQRLYEDHVIGKLTAERFTKLSEGCEQEQAELKKSAKVCWNLPELWGDRPVPGVQQVPLKTTA